MRFMCRFIHERVKATVISTDQQQQPDEASNVTYYMSENVFK